MVYRKEQKKRSSMINSRMSVIISSASWLLFAYPFSFYLTQDCAINNFVTPFIFFKYLVIHTLECYMTAIAIDGHLDMGQSLY